MKAARDYEIEELGKFLTYNDLDKTVDRDAQDKIKIVKHAYCDSVLNKIMYQFDYFKDELDELNDNLGEQIEDMGRTEE